MMEPKDNEYSTNTSLGKRKFDEEFSTDCTDEDEYDALNDETFGGEPVDDDWEESHDKYAEMLVNMIVDKGGCPSKSNSLEYHFFDSTGCDGDETQQEIVSKSISQLGLEDDLDDPAIMTVGRCHNMWNEVVFRSSPPPPAILDPEFCGSPKTHSIWSTNHSTQPGLVQENSGSLFQLVSNSLNTYQPSSLPSNSENDNSVTGKTWTVDELERKLLSSTAARKEPSSKWISTPNEVVKNNQGRDSSSNKSPLEIQSCTKDLFSPSNKDICGWPILPHIHSGAKTLDEVEKDLLNRQTAAGEQEINRQLKQSSLSDNVKQNESKLAPWPSCDPNLRFPQPIARPANRVFSPFLRPTYPVFNPRVLGSHPVNLPIGSKGKEPGFNSMFERQHPPPPLYPTSVLDSQMMNLSFIGPNGRVVRHPLLQERHLREKQIEYMRSVAESNGLELAHHGDFNIVNAHSDHDEYAGLMSQQEKEWLLRIQLMLVQTDNPYVEDFYYSTFITKKYAQEGTSKGKSGSQSSPKLLLPERAKTESKAYVPAQFEGSLGKLQAVSVNFPRKVLDIAVKRPIEEEEDDEIHDIGSHNYKKHCRLLLEIEKLYNHLLEIDDEEKRILALPEDAHQIHIENIIQHTDKLFIGLGCDSSKDTFQSIMSVRKGRNLGIRCFKVFSKDQRVCFLRSLFHCFHVIFRKDQNDLVLTKNIDLILEFIETLTLTDLVLLGESLEEPSSDKNAVITSGREKSIVAISFRNSFGSSIICGMLQQAELLYAEGKDIDREIQARWTKVILNIVDMICAMPNLSIVPPTIPCKYLIDHFQRFAVDRDKFEILKEKINILQINCEESSNV